MCRYIGLGLGLGLGFEYFDCIEVGICVGIYLIGMSAYHA